jgi:hypothetical protein
MNEVNEVNEASPASETSDVERVVMLPCPFCGHKCDLNEPDTLYPNGIYWRYSDDLGVPTLDAHINYLTVYNETMLAD